MIKPISTMMKSVDLVLGGGITPGGKYLFGASLGMGLTTLALQIANGCSGSRKMRTLFVSGEQTVDDLRYMAKRVECVNSSVFLFANPSGLDVDEVIEQSSELGAGLLIVDSMQTCIDAKRKGDFGTIPQVNDSTMRLLKFAEDCGTAVLLLTHFNKAGKFPGAMELQHRADCLLVLEQWAVTNTRLFGVPEKNRFGDADNVAALKMTGVGLVPVG
jgi:DNA repair protein RadA/Sms